MLLEQSWQAWWVQPLVGVGAGWLPESLSVMSAEALHRWASHHPQQVTCALQVPWDNAPAVDPWLSQLMLAPYAVRREAFSRVCGVGCNEARQALDESSQIWCDRVARGMGIDPLPAPVSGESLLYFAVGDTLWRRLRVAFPRLKAEGVGPWVAPGKWPVIWAAALWQVQRGQLRGESSCG